LQSRRSNSERRRNCLVNLVINRFDAISAGDIGSEIGKTGSSRIGGDRGHIERAEHILDVGKGLSDTVGISVLEADHLAKSRVILFDETRYLSRLV